MVILRQRYAIEAVGIKFNPMKARAFSAALFVCYIKVIEECLSLTLRK